MLKVFSSVYHYLTDEMPLELEVVDAKKWQPTIHEEEDTEMGGVQLNVLMEQFHALQHVQAKTGTQAYQDGDIYGQVLAKGGFYVDVRMHLSGKVRKFTPDMIDPVGDDGFTVDVRQGIKRAIWRGRVNRWSDDPRNAGIINTLRGAE